MEQEREHGLASWRTRLAQLERRTYLHIWVSWHSWHRLQWFSNLWQKLQSKNWQSNILSTIAYFDKVPFRDRTNWTMFYPLCVPGQVPLRAVCYFVLIPLMASLTPYKTLSLVSATQEDVSSGMDIAYAQTNQKLRDVALNSHSHFCIACTTSRVYW